MKCLCLELLIQTHLCYERPQCVMASHAVLLMEGNALAGRGPLRFQAA